MPNTAGCEWWVRFHIPHRFRCFLSGRFEPTLCICYQISALHSQNCRGLALNGAGPDSSRLCLPVWCKSDTQIIRLRRDLQVSTVTGKPHCASDCSVGKY